ncbi:hypothetical protein BPAE_0106g00170 [Botrytis paeoniae]|uniref:Uncharacterized protein n=1 Tax=Botrytis paeoniae TaxID=278948 RepID=A0A4Z1FNE0_9HELO|nr:hypothetical protein BPAE_0106g00170 [Botrytis paeoniae]
MDLSKAPKTKPISAKKAARYKKIFDDPQKMKEIFEQCEVSSRWVQGLKVDDQASQCTKPDGNADEEEDNDDEEEELVASKYFKKGIVMKTKEQEKKIEDFEVGDARGGIGAPDQEYHNQKHSDHRARNQPYGSMMKKTEHYQFAVPDMSPEHVIEVDNQK